MLEEFIDFVEAVLPVVSAKDKDALKKAIAQFEKNGDNPVFVLNSPLEKLSQGDIISDVSFFYFDENASLKTFKSNAMIISTSCHIDNKDKITLVPVISLSAFSKGNLKDLKNNVIYDYMYIPDHKFADSFVDFETMNSISIDIIRKGIDENKIRRLGSLSQLGYYLLIMKLTIFLFRPEDSETQNCRII